MIVKVSLLDEVFKVIESHESSPLDGSIAQDFFVELIDYIDHVSERFSFERTKKERN